MIDEKKIEEAANAVVKKEYARDIPIIKATFKNGFKTGINWFLGNLWHDASEGIPTEKNKNVLMYFESYSVGDRECDYDEYYELCHTGNDGFNEDTWKIFCDEAGWCSKWLYIDDLLKEGK